MTNNQRSLLFQKIWNFEKKSNLTLDISITENEVILDNSEGLWNVSKQNLDHYWFHYFNEYGTCLQDSFIKTGGTTMPYGEYIRNVFQKIISNDFYGLVNIESYTEDNSWNICASMLPTTVFNCLRYTPSKMESNDVTAEFIIYQVICATEELHLANIPHLSLTLDNLYLDENFVVKLGLPNLNQLSERAKRLSLENSETNSPVDDESDNLDKVLWKWTVGEISNLEYLMYLNKLAGRTESDPNNHCMIPWVTDFREPYGSLRDLKLSKFRINKGDDHLNKIYQDQLEEFDNYENDCPLDSGINRNTSGTIDSSNKTQINVKSRLPKCKIQPGEYNNLSLEYLPSYPHHVSDILSELSYYAYMARLTPVDILKRSYRSFYNPQEFRWNMTKMYDWTPDECIPQFFTNPSVFRSMHSDMPDIELPEWCKTAEELISYHRQILESPAVSAELHHWIDLVFGYKLIGDEAIAAKNVHRQFADRSSKITNNGLTVLFRTPHPRRLNCSDNLRKYFGSHRPQNNHEEILNHDKFQSNEYFINIPDDYNPCDLLDYYKEYSLFIQDSCAQPAVEMKAAKKLKKSLLQVACEEDVISICCLIVEIFNFDKLRADYLFSTNDIRLRIASCHLLIHEDSSRVPIKFRDSVETVINNCYRNCGRVPNIFELKRSEKWLLFNKFTKKLFEMIKNIYSSNMDKVVAVKNFFLSQTENTKFSVHMLNLLTPHLVYLLKLNPVIHFDKILEVLVSVTQRFGLITGKPYFIKEVFPHIISLYPTLKSLVKSQHALLYQRTFLNLLLIRIGMMEFLNSITELLVHMLVIGQHIFGSMKESNTPDIDMKIIPNDTESLNEDDSSSVWYVGNGDDDDVGRDKRISQISNCSDGEYMRIDVITAIVDSDTISQSSMDIDEYKINPPKPNGLIPISVPTVLDNLPLSDPEIVEDDFTQPKSRNGSFTQLISSPFRKISSSKQRLSPLKSARIQLRHNLSQDCSKMSLAKLSCSSLIWLADLIGPIQASSRILSELLAQFLSCYQSFHFDIVSRDLVDESKANFVTGSYDSCIRADLETTIIFECLREFIALYGLAVVDHQFRHFLDTLLDKTKVEDFGEDTETNLVCSLSLMRFLGMLIPDDYLENFLSDKILDNYLPLIIKCIGNMAHPFPNGVRARNVLFHKTIDLVYLLSSRMKFDQIQLSMSNIFKLMFGLFNKTFMSNENGDVLYRSVSSDVALPQIETPTYFVNFLSDHNDFMVSTYSPVSSPILCVSPSMSNRQTAYEEMKIVLTSELAYVLYITFAKLMGQNRLNSLICNHSLIQALVAQHENDSSKSSVYSTPDKAKQQKLDDALKFFTTSTMAHKKRHLNSFWNQYWVHELGFCDSEPFDIKQMCLGKFEGHSSAVKGFDVLNCENGFLSYGKDKVVKLFSCADIDYSNLSNEVTSRFCYTHQKSVTDALFIEQMRMAISLDGLVHLWDPFVGKKIQDTSLGVTTPNWSMVCCIPPSHFQVAVANADGRVQIFDLRSGSSSYSYNLNISNASSPPYGDFATSMGVPGGFIKQIAGAPNGNQLILGNSEGFLSIVDLRMSKLLQTTRPHQYEITEIKFMKNWCITSSSEPNGKLNLFSLSNFSKNQVLYGSDLGAIHSLMMLRNQILVGASQNRFGLFTSLSQYKSLNRLSSSLYKGTVSTASLLLHNRLMLLGNDTGGISLWY